MNKVPKKYTKTQIAKQQRYVYLLKKIADLLERDSLMTKRDIYYQNVQMFSNSQKILDEYVDDITCSLGVTRNDLHIVASSKGLVFGHLEFYNEKQIRIDCLSSTSDASVQNKSFATFQIFNLLIIFEVFFNDNISRGFFLNSDFEAMNFRTKS